MRTCATVNVVTCFFVITCFINPFHRILSSGTTWLQVISVQLVCYEQARVIFAVVASFLAVSRAHISPIYRQ